MILDGMEREKYIEYLDLNLILFEGEYLNGNKNGKVTKYFSNGKIFFEGEYLNGIIWNGKGYNKNGDYDFEIRNGKGTVKLYDNKDNLRYEGEYLNGKKNEKGKEYYSDGQLDFEGEFVNGKRKENYMNDDLELKGKNSNEEGKQKAEKKMCLIH